MAAPNETTKKKPQASKKKASSKKTSTPGVQKDSCFLIMPFGGWFDDYYTTIFAPAIEAAGLQPRRADDLYRPSTIVSDIWEYTRKAKLILADLSGKNPNVFYELGLAHALAKPAILLVESIDDIPFDLRALRVLEYDKNDPNWGTLLQEKIEQAINEVLAAPHLSVPAAFVEARPPQSTPTLTVQDKEMLAFRQELNLLRRQVRDRPSRFSLPVRPAEAREMIKEYLAHEMPREIIVRRMADMGVPEGFINRNIDELEEQGVRRPISIGSIRSIHAVGKVSAADAALSAKTVSTGGSSVKQRATKRKVAKKKAQSNKGVAKKKAR